MEMTVSSANQPIFMWDNFCVGGCMYYIDTTISHGDVSFFYVVEGCMGLICFYRSVAADWFENHWPTQNRQPNQNWIPQLNERDSKFGNIVN